ncbi:MAG TPA: AAA family ATPase [Thermomicrobiales bacterium]|nr:AAA family ATPase [Thermomicrobiales bacterium]
MTPAIAPLPPLVGRERELAALREHLALALDGRGSLVLIGGEAGIGKTALAEALAAEAGERGALVLIGRCYDRTETPPYGPFLELLHGYAPADGLPPAPLARWRGVGEAGSRAALYEQILGFFRDLARRRPLVLLFEDLHWADDASLDLLRVLARALAAWPALALATYRADELTRRHPLYALLPLLERESPVARVAPRPLDDVAITALAQARYPLPAGEAARLVAYLTRRAEGNPLYVVQLLRALEEGDHLRRAGAVWRLGALDALGVPASLVQVIDARLARLDEATRALLGVAAVVGQEAPLRLWATAAAVEEEAVIATAEAATAIGLVEVGADGARARFVHALIREAVYEGIFPPRRRVLHRRVGEVLAAVPAADADAVAYHFERAGDARARGWLMRAGERARRSYAYRASADRLERALALAEAAGPGDDAERVWLLVRLGLAQRFLDLGRGVAVLERAVALADRGDAAALAAACRFHLGHTRVYGPDLRAGIAEMAAGIAALGRLPPAIGDAVLEATGTTLDQARAGLVLYFALVGRFGEALALASETAPAGLRTGVCYLGAMYAHAALGRPGAASAAFERAAAMDRAIGSFRQLAVNYTFSLTVVGIPYAPTDGALLARNAEWGARAWDRARDTEAQTQPAAVGRFPLLLVAGRWDEIAAAVPALDTSNSSFEALIANVLGPFARARGEPAAAWEQVRRILPAGPATEPGGALFFVAQGMQRLAAALALDAGDLAEARRWLAAHGRWLAWSGATLGRAEGALGWAAYHRAAGDPTRARERAEQAHAHASDPRQPLALLAARRLLGELAMDAGRYAEAAAHLTDALVLADACAAPYERAVTLLALAEVRAATRQAPAARSSLEEARAICARLGAAPALARAEALAAQLGRAPAPARPAGLSAREVEVLRLAAAGRTNREIAAALCLGERTVQTHLRSILAKTDTANRTAAAAFARDHGLA